VSYYKDSHGKSISFFRVAPGTESDRNKKMKNSLDNQGKIPPSMDPDQTKSDESLDALPTRALNPGRIVSSPDDNQCLNGIQLGRLEHYFEEWVKDSPTKRIRGSRGRLFIIFLLIRYTGAKLSEVLFLDPQKGIDFSTHTVRFDSEQNDPGGPTREVRISEALSLRIQSALNSLFDADSMSTLFDIDPGFVRRKFYECAKACGFQKRLGGPEMIRKARAVELMQGGMPLPAVQAILGHSTPNLTSAYVSFSDEEIHYVTKHFMERESLRKTSARNTFSGIVRRIHQGDIQALVELETVGGDRITTMITNESVSRLGLKAGIPITAEVKAPWVLVQKTNAGAACSADNKLKGRIEKILKGEINTELVVRLPDGNRICSIISTGSARELALRTGEEVWMLFSCYAVVLLTD
jgi:molybdate transport system regulatory protein